MNSNNLKKINVNLPVIPLINTIMLPYVVSPIIVGRENTKNALMYAISENSDVICIPQINEDIEGDPKAKDLFRIGTLCKINQIFKLPDGNSRILLEGVQKVIIDKFVWKKNFLSATATPKEIISIDDSLQDIASIRLLKSVFKKYIKLEESTPQELWITMKEITDPVYQFYFVLANNALKFDVKQKIFEINNLRLAIEKLCECLQEEMEILELELKLDDKVKQKLNKLQKEYYLVEQLKIINKELGKEKNGNADIQEFRELLAKTPLNEEAKLKAEEEIKKLGRIVQHSQEYAVVHSYLKWIFDLPWHEPKPTEINLDKSLKILDDDHYGLKKVKERIIEYLAVLKFAGKAKGQILCLIGPPGVGKTSLGKSIAKALDREFIRLSLGGVGDEAEIRGHRKTYVGAMPGIIMKSMKKAKSKNPLIMMDEIDKLSRDFKGDPASALLEVLDSEQNNNFRDHYLDFGFDLSSVMFIMTANTYSTIPQPLLDRMEVLDLPGYTENEKENIAKLHLIPKSLKEHNINDKLKIKFNKTAIKKIIGNYTRESGVRSLERNISKVVRKSIKNYLQDEKKNKVTLSTKNVKEFLGVAKFNFSEINDEDKVGVVTGLAWTAGGGETLSIEILKLPGTGKLKLTGKLGEVMQESAQAALSYARFHSDEYGIDAEFHKKCDLHMHIPEGAIPKDGPSAGVTIVTAMISVLSNRKVKHKLAMTGEISLTGNVLPIGGLPEKLIAAKRVGIVDVIIPEKNRPNLEEVNEEIKNGLNIIFAKKVEDVLKVALV